MKESKILLIAFGLLLIVSSQGVMASPDMISSQFGYMFSYNWLHDADGDGIPNCLDPDWYAPEDGSGYQISHQMNELNGTSEENVGDRLRLRIKDGSCTEGTGDQATTRTQDQTRDRYNNRLQDQIRKQLQDSSCDVPQ